MLIINENRNPQGKWIAAIDPTPFRGLFPEGWICQNPGSSSSYSFFKLADGKPLPNFRYMQWVAGRDAYLLSRPGGGSGQRDFFIGSGKQSWARAHDWNAVFPELLEDRWRCVRVGPSVDGITWQHAGESVSSAMPELFPDGVLICNRRGYVTFFPDDQTGYSRHGHRQDPRSNDRGTDWASTRDQTSSWSACSPSDVPEILRCFHFPAELEHRKRQVRVGSTAARRQRVRGIGGGFVGGVLDTFKWMITGIDPKEGR